MKSRRLMLVIFAAVLAVGAVIVLRLRSQSSADGSSAAREVPSVTVTRAARGKVSRTLGVTGTLEGIHESDIISEASGKVTKINAEIEDYVNANASIAEIENDLQEVSVEAARVNCTKAEADFKRVKNLFDQHAVSETQLESAEVGAKAALSQLKFAQKNYDNTFLRTPIAGRVAEKFVVVGQMVAPGNRIATVVDDRNMKLKVGIPENFVSFVGLESEVRVTADAVPGKLFIGKVKTIALKADQQTRTFQIEIEMPNDKARSLRSGMFAKAVISAAADSNSIIIPIAALVEGTGDNPAVFVVKDSLASLKQVVVGARNDSVVEVRSGLNADELVVDFGQQNLKDGVKVSYKSGK